MRMHDGFASNLVRWAHGCRVGFFSMFVMIRVLFRKFSFSFSFWTVLSMLTSDNVVEGALKTSARIRLLGFNAEIPCGGCRVVDVGWCVRLSSQDVLK